MAKNAQKLTSEWGKRIAMTEQREAWCLVGSMWAKGTARHACFGQTKYAYNKVDRMQHCNAKLGVRLEMRDQVTPAEITYNASG